MTDNLARLLPLEPAFQIERHALRVFEDPSGKLVYDPKIDLVVPRNHLGLILINLVADGDARLELVWPAPKNPCTEARLSDKSVMIVDDNYCDRPTGISETIEFNIEVNGTRVDPRIINQ